MISVQKADGTSEPFDREKMVRSLRRAGVPKQLEHRAIDHIESKLYDGIQSWELYQHVSEFLGSSEHPYCKSKYSLKQAIMMLGPTGYPFEDFVAKILEIHGYKTEVRQILNGKCITHEVDVIASKDGKRAMIEAKFHNNPGNRSDVHVALYTKSRFDDVKIKNRLDEGWLVTNTKATTDAIGYAKCENLKIVSWGYPEGESLRDLIEKYTMHPITMLTTLSTSMKAQLLGHHIVLCKDICANHTLLDMLPLSKEEKQKTLDEIHFICEEEKSAS
ncbi:MAG: restriction endonuclease [bacterium]|nr:restriction endonuclease [bacterium]